VYLFELVVFNLIVFFAVAVFRQWQRAWRREDGGEYSVICFKLTFTVYLHSLL